MKTFIILLACVCFGFGCEQENSRPVEYVKIESRVIEKRQKKCFDMYFYTLVLNDGQVSVTPIEYSQIEIGDIYTKNVKVQYDTSGKISIYGK